MRTMQQLDLRDQQATYHFFEHEQPEYVFLAAAKVGGIKANNDFPASFIYDNLMIEANVIHAAYKVQCKKTAISRFFMHLSTRMRAAH